MSVQRDELLRLVEELPEEEVGRVDELWDHFEKPLHEVIARAAARPELARIRSR